MVFRDGARAVTDHPVARQPVRQTRQGSREKMPACASVATQYPFAAKPSKQVSFTVLLALPYVRSAYRSLTPRTFRRELTRLTDLGFIRFTASEGVDEASIELDFSAIAKY